METQNWVVGVLKDLIKTLDTVEYEVARYHLYDAIAAIHAAHGMGAADPLVPNQRREIVFIS